MRIPSLLYTIPSFKIYLYKQDIAQENATVVIFIIHLFCVFFAINVQGVSR